LTVQCSRCGHENRAGAKFCEQCASPLARRCRQCGAELSLTARFCPECAHPTGVATASPATSRSASPDSYTPRYLAERILNSRAALEGERKHVTVLFADMKGSMELLADRDPEEARQILDPVLSLMMDAVHRYEGTVNQVLGDGIMAIFGAPVAHEDHAVRACYAALTMLSAVGRANDDLRRHHGVEVQIRVGLNSGEVVVRSIGNDLHMEYSAVGQTTHLAARMEQLATPGTVRLTVDTARLAEGFVRLDSLGALSVKGLAGPVEMFELAGAATSRGRLQAAVARGLTPFVGRQSEMAYLETAVRTAAGGLGQLVAIVGEPGVGKSRLYWEFTHSPRTSGWVVLESSSVSYGKATAWGPLIDLLHRYFGIEESDDARRIREKVAGKLLTLDESLRPSVTPIAALLGLPVDDARWQKLEPRERRQETLDAVKRVILREAQLAPVLLVFEDLHWIDAETQAFLDALVPSAASARLLILVNYRPEYVHGWTNQRHYAQLRIGALGPDVAGALLDELLGIDASVTSLKAILIERTEGNPFFLEESVRSLVETGHLTGRRGAYRLARPAEGMAVPATVRAVLDARIDRLSADDKRLLQCAAVIGKDVPFKLLEAVAGQSSQDLHAALNRLATAELLLEARLFPELELSFRHAITHEVTYASLLTERRRELHGAVLDALLRGISPQSEPLPQLAHHAYRAGRWDEALEFLRRVAAMSMNRSANEEAASCLERAVEALTHSSKSPERDALEIDARLELRAALFRLGRHADITPHLARAQLLAETLDDAGRLARIHADWATHYGALGDDPRFEVSALSALESARKVGDTALELTATFHLAQLYARTAQYARAAGLTQRLVDAGDAVTSGDHGLGSPQLVVARLWLLWCLAELGRFEEGLQRAQALVRDVTEPFERLTSQLGLGLLHLRQGHVPEAIATLETALPLCRTPSLAVWFPAVASPLGYAYALNGRTGDGLALLQQAVEATTQRGAVHPLRMAHLAEAHLLAGDADTARDLAHRAIDAARSRGERAHEAYALRVLGCSTQSHRDAESMLQHAVELADALEMHPLATQARLDLAARYAKQGKRRESETTAAAATRLLDALGMRDWRALPRDDLNIRQ
jgi:class 3 adenylate cyclase/tetratricopeptide (TPR) repeat protein